MNWSRFWQRQRRDADLRRELDAYIELEVANRIADGMSTHDARVAAERKLGNVTRIRETLYEQNSLVTLETLWQDLRFGARLLRRTPGFAVVAVLSIALGIGANASVFTLLDQVMLRPLPVDRPGELVIVTGQGFQYGNAWGDGNELSFPMYADLRDNNQVFSGMLGRFAVQLDVGISGSGERVHAELVSGTYFPVLNVPPALGRVLDQDDERAPRGHPVVVLSHRYWRDRFRSDPAVIGSSLRVTNHPMTIVGIAREGFDGTNLGSATDLFVPIAMAAQVTPIENPLSDRRMRWVNVFGRLRPGVGADRAKAALQPFYSSRLQFEVQQEAFAQASARDKGRFVEGSIEVTPAAYGKSALRAQLADPLWTLTVIGVGVLIIACANVANLLLARSGARRREIAVRLALGATRRRIVRQLLVESVLLAVAGGAAGLVMATWGAQALLAFFTEPDTTLTISPWPDERILAVNVFVSVAIGILFGLAPAWQSTRPDVGPVLKAESVGVLGGGYARLRKGLVIAQVALSLLLLVGAGLFLRSLNNLLAIDAGFDTSRLLSFGVAPGPNGYAPAETKTFAKTLLERVRATPGVEGAAFVSNRLLEGGSWNSSITIEGRAYDPNQRALSYNNLISPGYFATMGIRLIAGRDFDARDERQVEPGAPPAPPSVAIVNEQFVRQFLNGRQPIGLHIGFGRNPGTPTPIEIVGLVTTAKYTTLRSDPRPQVYFPYLEAPTIRGFTMYVRTPQNPDSLAGTMRQIVQQIDPRLPVHDLRTMEQEVHRSLVNERFVASLSSLLAVLATLLAMIGLYGVMSYTVARRTREIAIRVAFGAVSSRVTALIVGDMLALVAAGMLLALPAFWWLKRFVSSQLYGVSPTDATAVLSAAALLLAAAAIAVWVPSRRALRVNPMVALRDE
jgi:predicted permease